MEPAESNHQIAQAIRSACLDVALAAYEDAGVQGLCEAGRWEAALGAIQSMDLYKLRSGPAC